MLILKSCRLVESIDTSLYYLRKPLHQLSKAFIML